MKILIADDEPVTRDGLYSSIDWSALGIETVLLAEDGLHALTLAKAHKPDIILSDVRMPRMNGLEMVAALEAVLPDTAVIFMSGYSDKEYLKTAIRLRAVTYVEKPIVEAELIEALTEAAELVSSRRRLSSAYSHEQLRHIGQQLTRPLRDPAAFLLEAASAGLELTTESGCYPLILRFGQALRTGESGRAIPADQVLGLVRDFFVQADLPFCYTDSHTHYLALFIFSEPDESHYKLLLEKLEQQLEYCLQGQLLFQLCAGEYAPAIRSIHEAYTQTVVLSQQAFFYHCRLLNEALRLKLSGSDSETMAREQATRNSFVFSESDAIHAFRTSLDEAVCEAALQTLEDIYRSLRDRSLLLPTRCKDLYYRLALEIEAAARRSKQSLRSEDILHHKAPLLEAIEGCFSLMQLHCCLTDMTQQYFDSIENKTAEDRSVYLIKEYIHEHYAEETLSIKQISEHVFLSVSYLCTYFKAQTGQTLNQYITEYRMDRACRLLEDGRIPITDIAARVGYSNSNYFGKGFKKYSGQTPSAYRDSHLR
ncbi:MAG: response regulator [Eubacteriales bacterium]|nr:response regulator [Eubacteriales bacterium]